MNGSCTVVSRVHDRHLVSFQYFITHISKAAPRHPKQAIFATRCPALSWHPPDNRLGRMIVGDMLKSRGSGPDNRPWRRHRAAAIQSARILFKYRRIGIFRRCLKVSADIMFSFTIPHAGTFDRATRYHGIVRRICIMDKNRIAGSAKQIKGAAKEAIGTAIGDSKLRADGKADKAEGKIQNAIGGVTDAVREALKP
jgi:uncharacterized protein YjbJ (UPF0337 family)